MSDPSIPRRGPSAKISAARLGAAIGLASVAVATASRSAWRPEWDSAIYLLLGRSLAVGEGLCYLGEPFTLRPPGFAAMLSPLLALGVDAGQLVALSRLALAGVAVGTFALVRRSVGTTIALPAALLVAASPLLVRHSGWVLSDLPFLALLLSAFAISGRPDPGTKAPGRARELVAGGIFAAAILVRSVGLLALPALLVVRGSTPEARSMRRSRLRTVVVAAVLVSPWFLWARAHRAATGSEQLLLHDYSTALFRADPGDPASPLLGPADWTERFVANGSALLRAAGRETVAVDSIGLGALLVAIAAVGWARSVRSGDVPPLLAFAAFYGLLVLAYFTFDERLLMPLVPAWALGILLGLETVVSRLAERFGAAPGRAARIGLCALPLLLVAMAQDARLLEPGIVRERRLADERFARDERRIAEWIGRLTPPGAVVLAGNAPVLSWLAHRPVKTYAFARSPGIVARSGARFVVLEPGAPPEVVAETRRLGRPLDELPLEGGARRARLFEVGDPAPGDPGSPYQPSR